jgi:hypothetical protein
MNALVSVWLPILLSAGVVFVISSLVHMVFKWHASDYSSFANEEAVRDAIRAGKPAHGRYVLPYCGDMKDMASEAMKKKYAEGPVGHITILPNGAPNMGKHLGQWFLWCLIIATVAAFVTVKLVALDPFLARRAAKVIGALTFIAHGFGTVTESIWRGRPWSSSAKYLLDAALYAIGSAAVFYWLWE